MTATSSTSTSASATCYHQPSQASCWRTRPSTTSCSSIIKEDDPMAMYEKKKRKVTFQTRVRVRQTLGRHEMTRQERVLAWYRKQEYAVIAKRCHVAIHQWDLQNLHPNNDIQGIAATARSATTSIAECFRGLERYTKNIKRQTWEKRRLALQIVLEEQERQEQENEWDDHSMYMLYYLACLDSRRQSRLVGKEDAKEAELVYQQKEEEDGEENFDTNNNMNNNNNDRRRRPMKSSLTPVEEEPPELPRSHDQSNQEDKKKNHNQLPPASSRSRLPLSQSFSSARAA